MANSIQLGKLLIATMQQACGAPVVDRATAYDEMDNRFESVAVHLTPWRFNKYGDREGGLALVLGWRQ